MKRKIPRKSETTEFSRYGSVLRAYLKGTKTKLQALADYTELSVPSISAYCNGVTLPKPQTHERILDFIADQAVRDDLHSQFRFFTPDSYWVDDVLEICSDIVEGVYSLALQGFVRQATSQAREHLEISIDKDLRYDLQELLFMLLIVQSEYGQGHELAISVATDDLQEQTVREFRGYAMRGISSRSFIKPDFTAPFELLKKAFELANSAPTLIRPEHFIIVERMLGLQIVGQSKHFSVDTVKGVLASFKSRLKSVGNGIERGDTLEAISRCHIRLGDYSEATGVLNEISAEDQIRVLTLEERIHLLHAHICELTGELEEALLKYRATRDLCRMKHNLHHLRFAEMGMIRINERLLAKS